MGISGALRPSRNPAWKARGRTPLLQMAAHGGDEGRRRPAKVRLFPKDFLPDRQLRPPEVARILMEAAGREP